MRCSAARSVALPAARTPTAPSRWWRASWRSGRMTPIACRRSVRGDPGPSTSVGAGPSRRGRRYERAPGPLQCLPHARRDAAREKAKLIAALPPDGTAILNADDERVGIDGGADSAARCDIRSRSRRSERRRRHRHVAATIAVHDHVPRQGGSSAHPAGRGTGARLGARRIVDRAGAGCRAGTDDRATRARRAGTPTDERPRRFATA